MLIKRVIMPALHKRIFTPYRHLPARNVLISFSSFSIHDNKCSDTFFSPTNRWLTNICLLSRVLWMPPQRMFKGLWKGQFENYKHTVVVYDANVQHLQRAVLRIINDPPMSFVKNVIYATWERDVNAGGNILNMAHTGGYHRKTKNSQSRCLFSF